MISQRHQHYVKAEAQFKASLARFPGVYQPIVDDFEADPARLADVAHAKRFLERYTGDDAFRKKLLSDPRGVAAAYGLKSDPEEIRLLWDCDPATRQPADLKAIPDTVLRYRFWVAEKLVHRDKIRELDCIPSDNSFRIWRERQHNRVFHQLGENGARGIVHTSWAVELSKGCSGGCWFCGLGAGRKEADFLHTPENQRLWLDVLEVMKELVGPTAAGQGVLYWATDPLDNPDFELFADEFADAFGRFPQTTSVLPMRDVERTRRLLVHSRRRGCQINRFSVISLKLLEEIFAAFTAEELLFTELITQNIESSTGIGNAGRARGSKLYEKKHDILGTPQEGRGMPGTISCLSGFLFNMLDRTVKLVTPCPADDEWPEGYWTLAEERFDTANDLKTILRRMVKESMPTALRLTDPIAFRSDLAYASTAKGFQLTNKVLRSSFDKEHELLPDIAALVARGCLCAGDVAVEMEKSKGVPLQLTLMLLNKLFQEGVLEESPRLFSKKIRFDPDTP